MFLQEISHLTPKFWAYTKKRNMKMPMCLWNVCMYLLMNPSLCSIVLNYSNLNYNRNWLSATMSIGEYVLILFCIFWKGILYQMMYNICIKNGLSLFIENRNCLHSYCPLIPNIMIKAYGTCWWSLSEYRKGLIFFYKHFTPPPPR